MYLRILFFLSIIVAFHPNKDGCLGNEIPSFINNKENGWNDALAILNANGGIPDLQGIDSNTDLINEFKNNGGIPHLQGSDSNTDLINEFKNNGGIPHLQDIDLDPDLINSIKINGELPPHLQNINLNDIVNDNGLHTPNTPTLQLDTPPCTTMAGPCRMETYQDGAAMTHYNVSCDCYPDKADVGSHLLDLTSRPCPLVPKLGQTVDFASLTIVNCAVVEPYMPESIITTLRRSRHLEFNFQEATDVRLPVYSINDIEQSTSSLETVTFKAVNSTLSGISRGIVSGCQKLRMAVTNCSLGVLGPGALAGYDTQHADVVVHINNSNIIKLAKDSVQLPTSGHLWLGVVKMDSVDGGAVGGEGEVTLHSCRPGTLQRGAFNITSMSRLEIQGSVLAAVEDTAIFSAAPSPCEVRVTYNSIMTITSRAFEQLCKAAQVTWRGNTVMTVTGGEPLILETPQCPLPPSSQVTPTTILCNNCDVTTASSAKQLCAVYAGSQCKVCRTCPPKKVEFHMRQHCPDGPKLVDEMDIVCRGQDKTQSEPVYASAYTSEEERTQRSSGGKLTSTSYSWSLFGYLTMTLFIIHYNHHS